ncbi:MAG: HD domain-containing protein, partial [candidate division NC10 bacterium]|nr:HD domain-containing protein [candidate division NC10 bacterium]
QRWQLDLSTLRGGKIESDLLHRDFTINAMAWEIGEEALLLHDPLRGEEDLAAGLIRWCSPTGFLDDPLRLLRAVRLSAQLGFAVEEATREGMRRASHLLSRVSAERIRDEFFKILDQPGSAGHVQTLRDLGLLPRVLPGIETMYEVPQGRRHQLPLWEHSLETLQALEGLVQDLPKIVPTHSRYLQSRLKGVLEDEIDLSLALKFVALLHDIGKPATKTVDETGRVRFFGHEAEGRSRIASICRSLRLGRKIRGHAEALVASHLRPLLLASEDRWTQRAKYRFFRDLRDLGIDLLLLGWADLQATVGEGDPQLCRYREFLREMMLYYWEEFVGLTRAPLVKGGDIIQTFNLSPGPQIGLLLQRIQEAEAERRFATKEEGLEYLGAHLKEWLEAKGAEGKEEKRPEKTN